MKIHICKNCKNKFKEAYQLRPRVFCSRKCQHDNTRKPGNAPHKYITAHGYYYVKIFCPFLNKETRKMEHVHVWETANNRLVPAGHVVHHINHCKTDNRIENLLLMESSAHTRLHTIKYDQSLSRHKKHMLGIISKGQIRLAEYRARKARNEARRRLRIKLQKSTVSGDNP